MFLNCSPETAVSKLLPHNCSPASAVPQLLTPNCCSATAVLQLLPSSFCPATATQQLQLISCNCYPKIAFLQLHNLYYYILFDLDFRPERPSCIPPRRFAQYSPIILQKLCLPCANWCGVTVGWILSLAREIAAMMLNCGYEFQYGYCHVAFAVFHQFLNSADTISQNQTPVINPRDLKKKSIVLNFCLLFVLQS